MSCGVSITNDIATTCFERHYGWRVGDNILAKQNGLPTDAQSMVVGRDVGTTIADSRHVGGQTLSIFRGGNWVCYQETNSTYHLFGYPTSGLLVGARLKSIVSISHFWFSWAAFQPETRKY
jgi:Protein of unknown function (DUF3179)